MPQIETTTRLLLAQWQQSPQLIALTQSFLTAVQQILTQIDNLAEQLDVHQAGGIWLDILARRLNIYRPTTTIGVDDPRWGFDEAGEPFDQAPFRGDEIYAAVGPLNDNLWRRLVLARARLILTQNIFPDVSEATEVIDPDSTLTDNRDMTLTLNTALEPIFALAESIEALPRNAGVQITYAEIVANRLTWDGDPLVWNSNPLVWMNV